MRRAIVDASQATSTAPNGIQAMTFSGAKHCTHGLLIHPKSTKPVAQIATVI